MRLPGSLNPDVHPSIASISWADRLAEPSRIQPPTREGEPPDVAVAMIASSGLQDFVLNTLGSVLSCGVRPSQVFLFHSDAAADEYALVADHIPQENILPIRATLNPVAADFDRGYADFGTADFRTFTIVKWFAIRWLLAQGAAQVVLTDVDIAWIRSPLGYLKWIAKSYDLAIQNEAIRLGRAEVCTGFMSLTPGIDELLSALIDLQASTFATGKAQDDQEVMNEYLKSHPQSYKRLWLLPEAQFPNGLFAPMFSAPENLQAVPLIHLQPMIFHANWCIGLRAKQAMLTRAGLWKPGEWPISQ